MSEPSPRQEAETGLSGIPDTWPICAREAAAVLGVHERTVRRAIARGELQATKRSGTFQITSEEFAQYRHRHAASHLLPVHLAHATTNLVAFPATRPESFSTPPRPLSTLIGRERDVAAVLALIERDEVSLVTVTGPGGVGKTRLALAVAEDTNAFPDGVCFVRLASVRDPGLVGDAIAAALGVRGREHEPQKDRLAPVLRNRRMLLLLDNFEHVMAAAPLVASLLGACAGLVVLVTSRSRLRVSGEHEYVLPPLALDEVSRDPAATEPPPAVRLLVARAQAVHAGFGLTGANYADLLAICQRLDGLPLAIELAAVRLKVLPPSGLLARLSRSLTLLTGGARDLPARQQRMRDTIAWSYDLLDPPERALFRHLAVFVGGCSLPAAEHLTGCLGEPTLDAVEGLGALIDASLLRLDGGPTTSPRYVMLETVREFGQELLDELAEAGKARDIHASWFASLDDWLDPNMLAAGERFDDRLRDIEAEIPNLRAALAHLAGAGRTTGFLNLAGRMAIIWHHRGYLPEGRRWLEEALARSPATPTPARARALAGLSLILWTQGDHNAAIDPASTALAIARDLADAPIEALALHLLGLAETMGGDRPAARMHMEAALALWRSLDMPTDEAMALMVLGNIHRGLGNATAAGTCARAALAIFRQAGHDSGTAFALLRLAELARARGEIPDAASACLEAVQLWAGLEERWAINSALLAIANMAVHAGQVDEAATFLGAIDARLDHGAAALFPGDQSSYTAVAATARHQLGEDRLDERRRAGRSLALPELVHLAASVTKRLAAPSRTSRLPGDLTPREREVLSLLAEGRSNAEIADALFIGVRTVRSHVASILARLGVSSRTAAAAWAIQQGLR